jgi:hypothetical protein
MRPASVPSDPVVPPRLARAWELHLERRAAFHRFVVRAVLMGTVAAACVSIVAVSAGHPYAAIACALGVASAVGCAIFAKRPTGDAVELFEAMAGPFARHADQPSAQIIRGPWLRAPQS